MAHRCRNPRWLARQSCPATACCSGVGSTTPTPLLEKSEGHTVPALLWKVSVRDEALLDRYEGYPYYYDRCKFRWSWTARQCPPWSTSCSRDFACNNPSSVYLHRVRDDGYQAAGFDQAILDQALVETRRGRWWRDSSGPISARRDGDIPMDYDKLNRRKSIWNRQNPPSP